MDIEFINKQVSVPHFWGKEMWKSMHCIAARIQDHSPELKRKMIAAYFESLQYCLPCVTCQNDYSQLLTFNPVYAHTETKQKLSVWVWRLHNTVNKKLGVPLFPFFHITAMYGIPAPFDADQMVFSRLPKFTKIENIYYQKEENENTSDNVMMKLQFIKIK